MIAAYKSIIFTRFNFPYCCMRWFTCPFCNYWIIKK